MFSRRALYKPRKVVAAPPKVAKVTTKTVSVNGAKNGGTRSVPLKRTPRFFPTEGSKGFPRHVRKGSIPKLRSSITAGTVLIILAGHLRGKKVVFLKQLASGLLLVTGPFAINGIGLRRVNQAYVIATSTKIDLTGVKVDPKVNDDYLKRKVADKDAKEKKPDAARREIQKNADAEIVKKINATPLLARYMNTSFTLDTGMYAHALKF